MSQAVVVQVVLQRRWVSWRWGVQWPPIRSWQWQLRATMEADSLTATWEVAEELNVDHSTVIRHLKQTRKVKKLDKQVPHELMESQKNHWWSVTFSNSMQQQRTISWFDCDLWGKEDFIQQLVMTSSVAGPRRNFKTLTKHFGRVKLAPKKVHGHCLVICCRSDPLQLSESRKPLHLGSMLSKLMRCTKNCSWHWSVGKAQFSMTTLNSTLHNQCFKRWTNWAMMFCFIYIFTSSLVNQTTTSSSISTTFCRENTSTTSSRQKMLSKNSLNPKAWIFMLQE